MDREQALKILDLNESATSEDVAKRYDVLFRKFRNADTDSKGRTWEQIEEAYRFLMGIDYVDPEEERRKEARRKHPNPIFKLLGVDEYKARNFIHYYKWMFIVSAVAIAAVIWIVTSLVNRVDPDLKVILAGKVVLADTTAMEEGLKELVEGVVAPQIQCITLSDELDPQIQSASVQKLSVEFMVGGNDIFIMDKDLYLEYASYGAFTALDDMMDELGIKEYDEDLVVGVSVEGEEEIPPKLYGVDVSDSPLLRDYGVLGDTLIAAIRPGAENPGNGEAYFKLLIESVQQK
jgi:hypothetical protein